MLKILKGAIKQTNNNLMWVCSLYLFSVASTVYLAFSQSATSAVAQMAILYCLTMVAFFAGFFNLIKSTIKTDGGKFKFLEGIGDYFLPMLGIALLSLFFYIVLAEMGTLITAKIVGGAPVLSASVNKIMELMQSGLVDMSALDAQALHVVSMFMLVLWVLWCVASFVILYWVTVLYFENQRNIFVSLFISIKFLLKNFWKSLGLYIGLLFPIVFLSILTVLFASLKPFVMVCNVLIYYISVVFVCAVFLLYADNLEEKSDSEC